MKEQRTELLEKAELFVLDMDGTFYLGDRILDGALDFLKTVEESGRKYLFFYKQFFPVAQSLSGKTEENEL